MDSKKGFNEGNLLGEFSRSNSNHISFDLYKNFVDSEENFRKFGEAFSDFYYISCPPFENSIEQRKDFPEIYDILKRCEHMANGFPLEILIGKYSEESMEKARRITEEKRREFEGTNIIVGNPKAYMYLVGFFGGTTGRTNEEIIREIRKMFPDKVKILENH